MRHQNSIQIACLSMLILTSIIGFSQEHAAHGDHQDRDKTKKVRCAFDGMPMNMSVMTKAEIKGKTRYFCSSAEVALFKANPDRYLKTIEIGHLTASLNFLTIDEYKKSMGQTASAKNLAGKTHHVSLYMTQHGRDASLGDVVFVLKIDDSDGKQKQVPLIFNKMMKTFDTDLALARNRKAKIRLAIITKPIEM